ncbi:MAG TPA: cytochrome P460 family protein [Kofleriaceae bacterium]|nr:cytochrome P460 family protein [Kofleriaceae bacterium]
MRSSSRFAPSITLAACGLLAGSAAHAQGKPPAGDAAAGKVKAAACAACHTAIDERGATPHLAGQRAPYLVHQLKAFKAGERKNPFMAAMAGQLSDDDMNNIAAFWASQPAGSDATSPPETAAAKKSQMTFPAGFPTGFTQYLTTNNDDEHTVAKSYINAVGFNAVKAGKPLPDGTVIVVATYSAKLDASKKPVVGSDGKWVADQVQGYSGMEARAGWGKAVPELLRNDNWNYNLFAVDKKPRELNQAICLACHKPQSSTSYVFLLKDIQAKAGVKVGAK